MKMNRTTNEEMVIPSNASENIVRSGTEMAYNRMNNQNAGHYIMLNKAYQCNKAFQQKYRLKGQQ